MRQLRRSINPGDFEITCAGSLEELRAACREGHDLVVLDVSPPQLVRTLKQVRGSAAHQDSLLLVKSSHLTNDPNLVGVLPTYRAMPCSQAEMLALMRYFNEAEAATPKLRGVL